MFELINTFFSKLFNSPWGTVVGILIGGELRAEGSRRELMRKYEMSSLEDVFFAIADQERIDA